MHINQFINCTPSFQVLAEDQIERIVFSAMDVLERTGVRLPEGPCLELVKGSRAWVSEGSIARLPVAMVQEALRSHPQKVHCTGRKESNRLRLQKDEVHFGGGSRQPSRRDHASGQLRDVEDTDRLESARVADALPHYDFCMAAGKTRAADSDRLADGRAFLAMLEGCTKPLLTCAGDVAGLERQWEMAARLRGRNELRRNPLFMDCIEVESPLSPSGAALDKLLFCAEKGIPCLVAPCLIGGVNAPLSLAGALALSLATCFAASVLACLKQPGLPIVYAPRFHITEPGRTAGAEPLASPEAPLTQAAFADIVKWLRLPVMSCGGCTDADRLDGQAALEMVTGLYYAFLSGTNLIQLAGSVDSGRSLCLDGMVFCNEVMGMIKHIGQGIGTEEDHLALDLIEEIGPGGEYLTTEHTLNHFRNWFRPKLLDRSSVDAWIEGGRETMADRVRRETDRILAEHSPEPLEAGVRRDLEAVLSS